MRTVLLLTLLGCASEEEPLDIGDPPVELVIPDVPPETVALAAQDALTLALAIDLRQVWPAHVETLDLASPGCPNFFAGSPDLDNRDIPDDLGYAWSDLCTANGARRYAGWSWWDSGVSVTGDASTAVGATAEGSRRLAGDALVGLGDNLQLEFDGEASDAVLRVDAAEYVSWTYSARTDATLSGALVDTLAPGGLRADLFARSTGGDADTLELRGNVHLFEHRIQDRYDSLTVDLLWAAPHSTAPDACADEPAGWIGIRDDNAYWTELIFQPRYDDDVTDDPYDNDPFNRCDGCANVYIRGVLQDFTVCPDFSFVWDGALSAPEAADYALDMRSLLMDLER